MKPQKYIVLFLFGMLTVNMIASEVASDKFYIKEYYDNGVLKSEGWQFQDEKTAYWIFYHPNGAIASKGHFSKNKRNGYWHYYSAEGQLEKEGHYVNGSAEDWWIFHDIAGDKTSKFQFKNDKKNGYSLRYSKRKLMKAEKYTNDVKEGEWTSIWAFRRDNPGVSLK